MNVAYNCNTLTEVYPQTCSFKYKKNVATIQMKSSEWAGHTICPKCPIIVCLTNKTKVKYIWLKVMSWFSTEPALRYNKEVRRNINLIITFKQMICWLLVNVIFYILYVRTKPMANELEDCFGSRKNFTEFLLKLPW